MMSRIKQFNGFKVVKGIINNYKCNSNYCDSKCQLKTNLKINQLSLSIVIICYKKNMVFVRLCLNSNKL